MVATKKTTRADELIVQQQLAATRSQARALILAGQARTQHRGLIKKPGQRLPSQTKIIVDEPQHYVSRGGHKLAAFLDHFAIPVYNKSILDIGASTGGFTDCLLQYGAQHATCVDVGQGQLHNKLINDSRVINLEQVNARYLTKADLPSDNIAIVVIDVAFISLKKVLPAAWGCLNNQGYLIALVKPQFESTRQEITQSKGVIKDPQIHQRILKEIRDFVQVTLPHCQLVGVLKSPIRGGNGNIEFLIGYRKSS